MESIILSPSLDLVIFITVALLIVSVFAWPNAVKEMIDAAKTAIVVFVFIFYFLKSYIFQNSYKLVYHVFMISFQNGKNFKLTHNSSGFGKVGYCNYNVHFSTIVY